MDRIAIVGCGDVGTTLAYLLLQHCPGPARLMLFNRDIQKANGCAIDLAHSTYERPHIHISAHSLGNLCLCESADVVVITAGVGLGGNVKNRSQLLMANTQILVSVLESLRNCHDARFLVITNPVDNLTYFTCKYLRSYGIPSSRIVGLGTTVESARYRYLLADVLNMLPLSLRDKAYVIGEHGDRLVLVTSKLDLQQVREDCENIREIVRKGAYVIRNTLGGGPKYSIALCAWEVIRCLLGIDEIGHPFLTVSSYIEKSDHYLIKDNCVSLPVVLGRAGILGVAEEKLSDDEVRGLRAADRAIREDRAALMKSLESDTYKLRNESRLKEKRNELLREICG